MDPVQNGESSRSPQRRGSSPRLPLSDQANGHAESTGLDAQKSRLILPEWDIPQQKHLHPSHDLISLLSLGPLYNAYVRPYASAVDDDTNVGGAGGGDGDEEMDGTAGGGGLGKKKGKAKKLEKGYGSLLDDCIDPVPDGLKAPPSLIPLIHDLSFPPTGPGPEVWEGPIDILPAERWSIARLQIGSQAGYKGGEKTGVRMAEEKRRRKREKDKLKSAPPTTIPSGPLTPHPGSTPGTPLLSVPPPSRSGIPGFSSNRPNQPNGPRTGGVPPPINPARPPGSGPHSAGLPARPFTGTGAAGPGTPRVPNGPKPGTPMNSGKRPYDGQPGAGGTGMTKKAKIAGTRSASPMPSGAGARMQGQQTSGQAPHGQNQGQGLRPGLGKGSRARTEGM